jgi:4-hydroxy-2-oxoheptanedioate aldolase
MNEPVMGMLSQRLADGGSALTAWVGVNEPAVAELFAREAFDAVTLDMQHGSVDFAGAVRSIQSVALAGKPAIVRIPVGEFATASRLLDFGASGIIAPFINSADDARRFVDFVKFPPVGERSWGPRLALPLSGLDDAGYLKSANGLVQAIAMIETRAALDELEAILATPGLDGVFVGPFDLSITLAGGKLVDPESEEVDAALNRIVKAAHKAQKVAGVYSHTAKRARALAKRGFRFITAGSDSGFLRAGLLAVLEALKD